MGRSVFELDKQTLADLSIFPDNSGNRSVLWLFDHAVTIGGKDKLVELFKHPLTDSEQIVQRIDAIKYLQQSNTQLQFNKGTCDYIEFYLTRPQKPATVSKIKAIEKKVMYFFTGDNDFYVISRGIENTLHLLHQLDDFANTENVETFPKLLQDIYLAINDTIRHPDFIFIRDLFAKEKLSAIDIARADHLFRYKAFDKLKELMDIVYQLDVFISVGAAGKDLGFTFPIINKNGEQTLKLKGLTHPFIKKPVGNAVEFDAQKNVCFVTGANMAGKSTFLRSVGVSVFLSQIGFPVPADYMETSVFDGLITTINLADNVQQGNSHFFAEVSRVKHVAETIGKSQNVIVIFDELFRGTNVKDAFDASLSIISAFSKLRKSFFIISTHIVEVAHELMTIDNIDFKYMESTFDNDVPKYSYQLRDGITEERLGMWIVKNEGIVAIIEDIVKRDEN